jgi:hypothetical protein
MPQRKSSVAKKRLYKVIFSNQGKVYEVYARRVSQGSLYGFIEVEQLVFGEKSLVVIDPTEERLRTEFDGVRVSHIPLHSIIRIDEVEKQGVAKIVPISGKSDENVLPFQFPPGGSAPKKGGE